MWLARVALLLLAVASCKRVTSTSPDDIDAPMLDHNLHGTWSLSRGVSSAIPQPPRTTACPTFSAQYQPTALSIVDTELSTNGGRPVGNVTFFGTHDLEFSESESWTSVEGVVEYVVVYYQIDKRSTTFLDGTASALAEWPEGACIHELTVSSLKL